MTGCEVAVDSTLTGVGSEAATVDEGAGGSVGAFTWPVHPTIVNIIRSDIDQFEWHIFWLFIVILLYWIWSAAQRKPAYWTVVMSSGAIGSRYAKSTALP